METKKERKQQHWKKTGLPSTVTIKQHSATSGLLGAEGDVRTEKKTGNTAELFYSKCFNTDFQAASPCEL